MTQADRTIKKSLDSSIAPIKLYSHGLFGGWLLFRLKLVVCWSQFTPACEILLCATLLNSSLVTSHLCMKLATVGMMGIGKVHFFKCFIYQPIPDLANGKDRQKIRMHKKMLWYFSPAPLLQCPTFGKHLLSSTQLLPGRPTPTDSSLTKEMVTLFHPWLFSPRFFSVACLCTFYKSPLHCPWLSNWYLH